MSNKVITVPERIDRILSDYANLEKYSHEMLDLAVEEMRLTDRRLAFMPFSVVKQNLFTAQAGYMLNVPNALKILREQYRREYA
jgi:hypothetical protein